MWRRILSVVLVGLRGCYVPLRLWFIIIFWNLNRLVQPSSLCVCQVRGGTNEFWCISYVKSAILAIILKELACVKVFYKSSFEFIGNIKSP